MEIFNHIYKGEHILDGKNKSFNVTLKGLKLKKIIEKLDIKKGECILDIGCGRGDFLKRFCLDYGAIGVGIDISREAVRQANSDSFSGTEFVVAEAERLPFTEDTFDLLISFDVLEHLSSPYDSIIEMSRVLKSGGRALIYTLNCRQFFTWHWWLKKLTHGRYGIDRGQCGEHDIDNFINPNEVHRSFEMHGLKLKKIIYFHAFFSLIIDEGLFYIFKRYENKKFFNKTKIKSNHKRLPVAKSFYNFFLLIILVLVELFEMPLLKTGYSNGFFIIAEKIKK